jgi:endonuclease/exonuclease/phosphatase (EEP) superfamily protein YafD
MPQNRSLRSGSTRVPALFASLALVVACCSCSARRTPEPASHPPGPEVTVMTYNVNFGIPGDPETLAAIAGGGADLVFLQETTPEWEEHLRGQLGQRYPYLAFRHWRGAGGLAVLSRHPFVAGPLLPNPAGWFPAWRVVVATPLGPVQVLNVHLRPPVSDSGSFVSGYLTTGGARHTEIRAFASALDPALPTLVVGDFNEGPSGRAITELRRRGLALALGSSAGPTWRWPTPLGTLRLRLDHILADRRLALVEARVLQAGRSDHLPVVATFVSRP